MQKNQYHEFDRDNRWRLDFLELSLLQVVPQLQAFASRGIPLVCFVLAYELLQEIPQLRVSRAAFVNDEYSLHLVSKGIH